MTFFIELFGCILARPRKKGQTFSSLGVDIVHPPPFSRPRARSRPPPHPLKHTLAWLGFFRLDFLLSLFRICKKTRAVALTLINCVLNKVLFFRSSLSGTINEPNKVAKSYSNKTKFRNLVSVTRWSREKIGKNVHSQTHFLSELRHRFNVVKVSLNLEYFWKFRNSCSRGEDSPNLVILSLVPISRTSTYVKM
jgi:hypothetical protein